MGGQSPALLPWGTGKLLGAPLGWHQRMCPGGAQSGTLSLTAPGHRLSSQGDISSNPAQFQEQWMLPLNPRQPPPLLGRVRLTLGCGGGCTGLF